MTQIVGKSDKNIYFFIKSSGYKLFSSRFKENFERTVNEILNFLKFNEAGYEVIRNYQIQILWFDVIPIGRSIKKVPSGPQTFVL